MYFYLFGALGYFSHAPIPILLCLDGDKLGNVWSASIPTYFTKLYTGDNFCAYLAFTPLKGRKEKIGAGRIIQALRNNPTNTRVPTSHKLTVLSTFSNFSRSFSIEYRGGIIIEL
jgi:hypothetical protein